MDSRIRPLALAVALCSAAAFAQTPETPKTDPLTEERFLNPPKEIMDAVLAPWWKNGGVGELSRQGTFAVQLVRSGLPKFVDMARPHTRLAGLDVETGANRARMMFVRAATGMRIAALDGSPTVDVPIPAGIRVSDAAWAPDGKHVAFFAHRPDRTEVWVTTTGTKPQARRLSASPVLPTLCNDLVWLDASHVVTVLVPKNRPEVPAPNSGNAPRVLVTEPKKYSLRTYASVLQDGREAAMLKHYATAQLARIGLDGSVKEVGKPAMIQNVTTSPDGAYLRVTTTETPFSYLYPVSSFPSREVLWDLDGKELAEIRKDPLRTGPEGRTPSPNERRALTWRPDGKGLSYLIQGPVVDGKRRDRVMQWLPPFGKDNTVEVWSSETRINSVRYNADASLLFIEQTVDGKTRTSVVKAEKDAKPVTLLETKTDDDPSELLSKVLENGASAVRVGAEGVLLAGTTYAKDPEKDAPKTWLDRVGLDGTKRTRLWESAANFSESASVLDDDARRILVSRQSPSQISNTFLVERETKAERRLTENQDFLPDLTQTKRERIRVKRADGVSFWVTVTYPSSYITGKLPAFFWFYPSEFATQEAYDRGQRTYNRLAFRGMSPANKAIFTRRGYLLVEPDCPILGEPTRKNDGYVPQLRNNLSAVIDELDRRGVIDRQRLAIGGHSYGAFSTVNAMIHTPFFRAGIAGDGNFNRTLTPFGFQTDNRQLWEARETYLDMSPILYAEQLTGALLMYHGIEDQNVGTDPMNSPRLFAALQALGKSAALYMYPYEDHGQIAQETVLDQWARWIAWLDKHLAPTTP